MRFVVRSHINKQLDQRSRIGNFTRDNARFVLDVTKLIPLDFGEIGVAFEYMRECVI